MTGNPGNPIFRRVWNRLHKEDKNYLAIFCGQTGSGKSESCIEFARNIDPNFSPKNIVFSVEDFFALLNSKKLKPGSAIVWEELGVSADSRTFFSLQNRAITYCFETFRYLNLAVLMNVPGLGMVDSRVRKLAHQYFETITIYRRRKVCKCKVMDMEYNPRLDKIYFKYPKIYLEDSLVKVSSLEFNKPPDSLVVPYLKMKKRFSSELNLNLEKSMADAKIDRTSRTVDIGEMVKEILENKNDFVHVYGGRDRVKASLLQAHFNLGKVTAEKIKSAVEMKLK